MDLLPQGGTKLEWFKNAESMTGRTWLDFAGSFTLWAAPDSRFDSYPTITLIKGVPADQIPLPTNSSLTLR
jgi:hypothetical protein